MIPFAADKVFTMNEEDDMVPDTTAFPETCNAWDGLVVPIPTFPVL
jgi:hypothetical protein